MRSIKANNCERIFIRSEAARSPACDWGSCSKLTFERIRFKGELIKRSA